eukprot:scaffold105772_cov69-Phaeocystis_antarctica.AAC.2
MYACEVPTYLEEKTAPFEATAARAGAMSPSAWAFPRCGATARAVLGPALLGCSCHRRCRAARPPRRRRTRRPRETTPRSRAPEWAARRRARPMRTLGGGQPRRDHRRCTGGGAQRGAGRVGGAARLAAGAEVEGALRLELELRLEARPVPLRVARL